MTKVVESTEKVNDIAAGMSHQRITRSTIRTRTAVGVVEMLDEIGSEAEALAKKGMQSMITDTEGRLKEIDTGHARLVLKSQGEIIAETEEMITRDIKGE